ncbi:MAG: NAD-dependent epimerase/dehydratase family protein [Planctomycetota bacterium]|nr:MAG: NAD-dependent epimerase/dehydratase family protein [Planctomycetota bacterium]
MSRDGWTLITGATGFIGHYALAQLLRRGVRCAALVRNGNGLKLLELLRDVAPDLACDDSHLRIIHGSLPDRMPPVDHLHIERVVHIAGSTRFQADDGEPQRTNVAGVQRLLSWMSARNIKDLTHVSTAYVCGRSRIAFERVEPTPPCFRNEYERTKWQAEQLVDRWTRGDRRVVIVRPSIVTGAFDTGRATQFRGLYVVARAVEQLARLHADDDAARRRITLRIRGRGDAANQIVPVDYVAQSIAVLATKPEARGVYHVTHPAPPTNDDIRCWLESIYDVAGGRFVGDVDLPVSQRSFEEQAFYGGMRPLADYFADAPLFDTTRAASILDSAGVTCPPIDLAYVRRCIAYARARRWGRAASVAAYDARAAAAYFERYLPAHLPASIVSRVHPVRATVRFIVDEGEWVCRFDAGRLESVQRGPNGLREQFGYRTTMDAFWRAISGEVDGEQLFARGEADVFGDVESALKMAAVLREFTREYPCDRRRLQPYMESS